MTTPANDNLEARLQLDLPREQYDNLAALGEVNWSTLKELGRSAAHFKYALDNPDREPTDVQARGIAAHVAVLEPEKYGGLPYDPLAGAGLYAVWPEENGKRGTKAWDAAEATCRARGQQLIREKEHNWCVAVATAVHSKPCARELLAGKREVTMRWSEHVEAMAGTGPFAWKLRGRVDLLGPAGIVDLKTTRDASIDGFMRQVAMYGYHAQASFYVDGAKRITSQTKPYFWIAVEAEPPHCVTVIEVSDQVLARGRDIYWEHLQLYRRCIESGSWPQYAEGIVRGAELPKWAMPFDDELPDETEQLGPTPRIGF